MKQLIFLLTTVVFILSSCNNNKTVIEGYVLQAGSDSPIENAEVEIEYGFSTDIISGVISVEDRVYTDATGYFYWETDEDFTGFYKIGDIGAENYFGLDWDLSGQYTTLRPGDKYSGTLHLDPFAYLRLHVEEVEEVEGSFIRFSGNMIPEILELYGETFENTFIAKGDNFEFNQIYYILDENGNTPFRDTLFISAFDTLDYTIKY